MNLESAVKMLIKSTTIASLLCLGSANAFATSLEENEKALNTIASFSDRLCKDIPLEGSGDNLGLSGSAKAELKGIVKKLIDLGVEGAIKYQTTEYEGLLQKDLVNAIQAETNCRLQIWRDLKDDPHVKSQLAKVLFWAS